MADRFARLTGPTVQHAQPKDIDFANLREEARSSQQMSQTADAVSNWAFKIANEQAEIEGAKYYAENPVTLKQIEQAKTLGKDPEDLFAGTWTTFDKAGRKIQMQQVSAEIEMQARAELTGMLADIKMGKADLDSLTDMSSGTPRPGGKLADLIDGLSSTVKDAMPELYPTIRASLATMANSTLSSAISEQATRTLTQRKVRAQEGLQNIVKAVPGVIQQGDMMGPDGVVITVEDQLQFHRNQVSSIAEYANDPAMMKNGLDSFDKAIKGARISALTDWADTMPDGPGAALAELRDGSFSNPAMEKAYKALDTEDQLKVREEFRKLRRDRVADQDTRLSADKKRRDEENRVNSDAWLTARSSGDVEGMNAAIAGMTGDVRKTHEDIMRKSPNGFDTGEAKSFGELKRAIMLATPATTPTTLVKKINKSLRENLISEEQASTLTNDILSTQGKDFSAAKIEISAITRYDPQADTTDLDQGEVRRRKALYETAISRLSSARRANPLLDIDAWISSNMASIQESENRRSLAEAKRVLEARTKNLRESGINPTLSADELNARIDSRTGFAINGYLDAVQAVRDLNEALGISND